MKVRVGLIGKFFPETGLSLYCQDLFDNLKKKCHAVSIGWGDSNCDYKINLEKDFVSDIEQIIQKEKLDVIHLQHITSGSWLKMLYKINLLSYIKTLSVNRKFLKLLDRNIRKVVTIHEVNSKIKRPKDLIIRLIEKEMCKRADKIIVHGISQMKTLSEIRKNVAYVPYGLHKFSVNRKRGKTILFQGMINPEKGLEYLIDAMKFLPDYRLIIKGKVVNKNYAELLETKIRENNLDNVEIGYGWINETEKAELYERSNIVALPYVWSPYQSGVLNEAFSYRIPVVVTNTNSPINETVQNYKCGVVVGMKNPQELASGIQKVYNGYKSYLKSVDRYRSIANWKAIAGIHVKIYKNLIATGN